MLSSILFVISFTLSFVDRGIMEPIFTSQDIKRKACTERTFPAVLVTRF